MSAWPAHGYHACTCTVRISLPWPAERAERGFFYSTDLNIKIKAAVCKATRRAELLQMKGANGV